MAVERDALVVLPACVRQAFGVAKSTLPWCWPMALDADGDDPPIAAGVVMERSLAADRSDLPAVEDRDRQVVEGVISAVRKEAASHIFLIADCVAGCGKRLAGVDDKQVIRPQKTQGELYRELLTLMHHLAAGRDPPQGDEGAG